jgi:hypothetical protein
MSQFFLKVITTFVITLKITKINFMKKQVIEFLRNLPESKSQQFNQAFDLYRKSDFANEMMVRALNMAGFSDNALANLLYDLKQLHEITDADIYADEVKVIQLETETNLIADANHVVGSNANIEISDQPVREEFPFLADKHCPDEFKILIADKLTAYNLYKETKAKITEANADEVSSETLAEWAKIAVNAFDLNQKIYAELNHYKEHGTVLGKHPIFRKFALQREVDEMTNDALIKFKNSSIKYFSTNKTDLAIAEKKKDQAKIDIINIRVAVREEKLALVNKKLGVEK